MSPAERELTRPELNRALLARQMLLERSAAPLPRVAERMGGVQAQYAPSMYVGLWTRAEGVGRDDVTRALERRTLVQGTLMRITIHVVSHRDYWPIALAVRDARRAQWLRQRKHDPDARTMAAAARKVRARLEANGPLHRRDIEALVGKAAAPGVGMWVDMVRIPPLGTWDKRRADLYELAERWVGPPGDATAGAGGELLVRRHLEAFGPAPRAAIADWAGLPVTAIDAALDRMRPRTFRGPDGEQLVDLPRAPLPDADTPAPPRFLPTWDATLLAHARRTAVLPEQYRRRIFHTTAPQSFATFLVDGQVAGTWRHADGRIEIDAFERIDPAAQRELDQEAERLAAFHA